MEVVGNGFLATHLRAAFGARYPRVTAVAAGVTKTTTTDPADFDREAELVYGLLRRCRAERRQLLFFSTASFAMYGSTEPAVEWGPVYPPVAYGRHKLALEACVRASGADYLILRLSHVVGQHRQPHQMLPAIVEQVLGGAVTIYRGAQRDLLDADDFCYAIDRMLDAGVTDMVVNVASGVSQPIERIVDGVERRLGLTAERLYVPGHGWRAQPSIDRLLALVPQFRRERIHAGYLDQILDAYLPHVVALTRKAALSTSLR
jgi:nucleoside-diphosphate-sugar epimerase